MYLVRAQLYWSVCNRIRWTKHRDEVAGGGWRGIGGKPSFGGYLQSPRLVSPCFRTPCIVKYYRQEKTNKSLPPQKILISLACWWWLWGQSLCSWGVQNGRSSQHDPCCSWSLWLLAASGAFLRVSARFRCSARMNHQICSVPTSAWFFWATRGVAALSLHNGHDLSTADVLWDFTDWGLVATSSFYARCSNSQDYARSQGLPLLRATGENVLCVSNRSAIWSRQAKLISVTKQATELRSTFYTKKCQRFKLQKQRM